VGWEGYRQLPVESIGGSSKGADGVLGEGAGLDAESVGNDGSDAGVMLVGIAKGKVR
jgi:hypothetical protein